MQLENPNRRGNWIGDRFVTERENFYRILNGEKPYWTPHAFDMAAMVGADLINEFGVRGEGGVDDYGVTWIATDSANGGTTPDPFHHIMECVTDWREVYKPIDFDAIDWAAHAERDLANVDRDSTLVVYNMFEGFFQRFMAFEGFENCLIDMIEEPEECKAFFEAMCDERIAMVEKLAQYYQPDIIVFFDDIAHQEGLFMSPEIFREQLLPCYRRLYAAMIEHGIIPDHHVCGKCSEIIPDIVDCGARIWQSAEPMNPIVEIQKQYGNRLIIEGGFPTAGEFLYESGTERLYRREVRRIMREYGANGNYIFMGMVLGQGTEILNDAIAEEYRKCYMDIGKE